MSGHWLVGETIRRKRDGQRLSREELAALAQGIADGSVADAQAAAFAMAVHFRGMQLDECAEFTWAMRDTGEVLDWAAAGQAGPVLDKHSTGGVGDLVSLALGPMLAACGALVPMISGRGLGHTGGTLDKLEAIPGYQVNPDKPTLERVLREAGVAIVGAGQQLAPADRRLYAIRDVTATVDCIPLIIASILSKKLAAGTGALVLDVKQGNGAVMAEPEGARLLAEGLVHVATQAGLPATALLTDMSQPLARSAGNALEVLEAVRMLRGEGADPRLMEVTLALGAAVLRLGGLAQDEPAARRLLEASLDSGDAAERFGRIVSGLGGPAGFMDRPRQHLAVAPVTCDVPAPASGYVARVDTRALGLAVVELGGGRTQPGAAVDPRVGLDRLRSIGDCVAAGEPLARVHAADQEAAAHAIEIVRQAFGISAAAPAPVQPVTGRVDAAAGA